MKILTISSIVIAFLFIALIRFSPVWSRTPGGLWNVWFHLLIPILFLYLIILMIIHIRILFKSRFYESYSIYFTICFIIAALFDGIFNPLQINLDSIYGDIVFRACYEGTQNQATFVLREDYRFEIHWTGAFFYDEYFRGTYTQVNDTLNLNYETDAPVRFGSKALMNYELEMLTAIYTDEDSLLSGIPGFYYGYCKGLN